MKSWPALSLLLIAFAGSAIGSAVPTAARSEMNDQNKVQQKIPEQKPLFACNMLALDAEQRRRHIVVTKELRAVMEEIRPLPDGYGFRLPSRQDTILLSAEFIARERLCCPFFAFELAVEPEDGPLWLRLRGPEGVKDFISAEFGIK